MKNILLPAAIIATLFLSAFSTYQASVWKIASGYSIKFTSENPSGVFTALKGSIDFDENNLAASKFDVSVDVASINTGNGLQNSHAKSANWFDAATYPSIAFVSSSITKTSTGFDAVGTLNMHGVKKTLTIPFTFKNNTFAGSFNINRLDYKIGAEGGAANIIKIDLSVPVTK